MGMCVTNRATQFSFVIRQYARGDQDIQEGKDCTDCVGEVW